MEQRQKKAKSRPLTAAPIALAVHHGTTTYNEDNLYTGMIDVPLSAKGVKDARRAAEFVKDYPVARVIASPLQRAFNTARFIAAPHKVEVEESRHLFPWQLPTYWGKSKDEFDDDLEEFIENPDSRPEDGETLHEFMEREGDFFENELRKGHTDKVVVFVAHTTNLIALCDLIDGTEDHDKIIEPGGVIGIYRTGIGYEYRELLGQDTAAE